MTMYGANPEQLATLGRTLQQPDRSINGVISTVTSTLGGTTWDGSGTRPVREDWNTTFKHALNRLNEAFEAAGQRLHQPLAPSCNG